MNGSQESEKGSSVSSRPSLDFSDNESEEIQEDHEGDYSTRYDELMSDTEGGSDVALHDEEPEEEGFFYSGVDAQPAGGYRQQLRDVLGPDHEDDELDEREVERSLTYNVQARDQFSVQMDDETKPINVNSDHTPSPSSTLQGSPNGQDNAIFRPLNLADRVSRPFLHPTISRLRSSTPQASQVSSSGSAVTPSYYVKDGASVAPSHFSALSRSSSRTDLGAGQSKVHHTYSQSYPEGEVFKWTALRSIGDCIYSELSTKASSLLGAENSGSPTVLAANGLICIGTDSGRVLVFDFKQNLKCICGSDATDKVVGPVTAVALSFDQTFVACGHASGHIQLFDLNAPKAAARFVAPTTLAEVAIGRQEGHIVGSRIVSVGFVAGRHTAIVSADDAGLAFYHRLGKVFFMDASDTLRLLGKYPDEESMPSAPVPLSGPHFRRRKSRKASTILAMGPLPLGTATHPIDEYNLIALLTPIKLVIVGLKPSPRTWYRRHREGDDRPSRSKFKGSLAWFPSVVPGDGSGAEATKNKLQTKGASNSSSNLPMLVHSWGDTLFLIRVSEDKVVQQTRNSRTGKVSNVEIGRVIFEETRQWNTSDDVLALQWLNVNQILVLTATTLEVHDVRSASLVEQVPYDAWSLVSPVLSHTTNGSVSYPDAVTEVAHSLRVYKGKIFVLGQNKAQVGTLLTWADRILSFVQEGDFLSAIELTRSYYVGESPGNRNGLPESPEKLKDVVGEKMRELMFASAQYAFSEKRMTDSTHMTSDGRGVDRTSLFEGLVKTCTRACIALGDCDYLFEDLFQYYDDNGITQIFLLQLEPFVLDGIVRHVPPRITQRLITLHEEHNHPDSAERIIWHVDPDCLDVNQAITLCQRHRLYDALIYVYTRAVKDFVWPIVELIGLIRKVQRYRRTRRERSSPVARAEDASIEPIVLNAYKIYPYLGNTLTGLSYPSAERLTEEEALQAKNDVYKFIFFGHSSVWPEGENGILVLTGDEENGVEPTYPYARLLLRFDPEAFLHTLDLAFEDSYFNDEAPHISRLVIVKILLEILSSPDLPHDAFTFGNIFIARNVPKYYKAIELPPSVLHSILINLAEDPDPETREDRQLAAEYLLSTYKPHESDRVISLFENAGFYRILRSWYQHDSEWSSLLMTYLDDPEMPGTDMLRCIDDVVGMAKRSNKGNLPSDLESTIVNSLATLLDASVVETARILDQHLPSLHEDAMAALQHHPDQDRFAYLRYLLGPPPVSEDDYVPFRKGGPSFHVAPPLRRAYISLTCRFDPSALIRALQYLPEDAIDDDDIVQICEEEGIYDAAIWTLGRAGKPMLALDKAQGFENILSVRLAEVLMHNGIAGEDSVQHELAALEAIGRRAVSMCLEHSQSVLTTEVPLEDMWYQLLKCQIDTVQRVASVCTLPDAISGPVNEARRGTQQQVLSTLRALVQDSFSSLLSISSAKAMSLPRMLKRLLTSASTTHVTKPTLYAEFRTLFTGMLESYRSDSDMLVITKHLVDSDVFSAIQEFTQERFRGWKPSQGVCQGCGESFLETKPSGSAESEANARFPVIVSRTGVIYHTSCLSPGDSANPISVQ